MTNSEIPPKDESLPIENPQEVEVALENDPFAKGRERIAAVGNFITTSKEKFSSTVKGMGEKVSRFWSRAKSAGVETVAAVLSADDLAKKGYDKANDWVDEKAEQASNFIDTKVDQVAQFGRDKVELAKDVTLLATVKTVDGLVAVKNGVQKRYEGLKSFGENAVTSALMRIANAKEAFRQKANEIRIQQLLKKYRQAQQRASDAQTANEQSARVYAAEAERYRQEKEELAEKLNLLEALKGLAA